MLVHRVGLEAMHDTRHQVLLVLNILQGLSFSQTVCRLGS